MLIAKNRKKQHKVKNFELILTKKRETKRTVGNLLLVQQISMQVLPTAPSPTVTHLMNFELDADIEERAITE